MQSTGHSSTQARSSTSMQGSPITYAIALSPVLVWWAALTAEPASSRVAAAARSAQDGSTSHPLGDGQQNCGIGHCLQAVASRRDDDEVAVASIPGSVRRDHTDAAGEHE